MCGFTGHVCEVRMTSDKVFQNPFDRKNDVVEKDVALARCKNQRLGLPLSNIVGNFFATIKSCFL